MQLYEAAQARGWQQFCAAQGLARPEDDQAGGWMAVLPWGLLQALVAKPCWPSSAAACAWP